MSNKLRKNFIIGVTLVLLAPPFVFYGFFSKKFLNLVSVKNDKFFVYNPKSEIKVKDLTDFKSAQAVPILLYHGIVKKEDAANTTLNNFINQMEALKKEGYETISLEQFYLFKKGKFNLPKRPIIITFDDGRKDSFYPTDTILKKLGFNAVLFVATGPMIDGNNFYLTKDEIKYVYDTGRWEIQAHGRYSHNHINSELGFDQRFLSSKKFLQDKQRYETDLEFIERIEADYLNGNKDLEEITSQTPKYLAVPMNDYGLSQESNYRDSFWINEEIIKKYYRLAFVQANNSDNVIEVVSSPFNMSFEDPFRIRRLEVKNMKADDLIRILEEHYPKLPSFVLDDKSFEKIIIQRISGKLFKTENGVFSLNASNKGANSYFTVGQPFWRDYKVSSLIDNNLRYRSVGIITNYIDWNNFVVCGFTDNSVFLREVSNGVLNNIVSPKLLDYKIKDLSKLEVINNSGLLSCSLNDVQVFSDIKSFNRFGGAGVLIWDDKNPASVIIKDFQIRPISDNI